MSHRKVRLEASKPDKVESVLRSSGADDVVTALIMQDRFGGGLVVGGSIVETPRSELLSDSGIYKQYKAEKRELSRFRR